jgi:DNA-binding NarL/FixJ family response regulator
MNTVPRILVVEDGVMVAEDLRAIVEKMGFEALPAVASATDALDSAKNYDPDLVLMDIRLEGEGDGVFAAEQMQSQLRIPVIYVTAHSDPKTLARAIASSPLGYITKPFTERSVAAAIMAALQQRRDWEKAQKSIRIALAALEQVPEGIIAVDRSGIIEYFNCAARGFLEDPKADSNRRNIRDVLPVQPPLDEALGEILGGMPHLAMELSIGSGEQKVPCHLLAAPITDTSDCIHGAVLQLTRKDSQALLPSLATLCVRCKNVRRKDGTWEPVENFLARSLNYLFNHGICSRCIDRLYGEFHGESD